MSPKNPENKSERFFLNLLKLIKNADKGKEIKKPPEGPIIWAIPPEKPEKTGTPKIPNKR